MILAIRARSVSSKPKRQRQLAARVFTHVIQDGYRRRSSLAVVLCEIDDVTYLHDPSGKLGPHIVSMSTLLVRSRRRLPSMRMSEVVTKNKDCFLHTADDLSTLRSCVDEKNSTVLSTYQCFSFIAKANLTLDLVKGDQIGGLESGCASASRKG